MNKGKLLFTVNSHSFVGEITNSSTELFCTVSGKSKKFIEAGIEEVMKEFGCSAVSLSVHEHEYEDDEGEWVIDKTKFQIWYDYEINHQPCELMKARLLELFEAKEEE